MLYVHHHIVYLASLMYSNYINQVWWAAFMGLLQIVYTTFLPNIIIKLKLCFANLLSK